MKIIQKKDLRALIEEKVDDGDLYSYYMPHDFEFNKNTLNPFKEETRGSFKIFYKNGTYCHKSYNSKHKGGIWDFIKDYFGINYKQALEKVAKDFGILEEDGITYTKAIQKIENIERKEAKELSIQCSKKPFTKAHIDYLVKCGIALDDLNIFSDTKVLALKEFWINKNKIPVKHGEVGFIYYIKSLQKVKIYLPERGKNKKFYSALPFDYIHGLEDVKKCNKLLILKSVKEAWLIKKLFDLCIIVVQAENSSAFNKETIELINSLAKEVYVSWDSDAPGVQNCIQLTKETGWKYVNPAKKYLSEGIKDWWELYEKYGKEPIEKEFKKKKII